MASAARPAVLFIDGDSDILKLMGYVFSDEPMELIARRTPEEGLQVLAQRPVDCVFLDIHFAHAPEGFGFMVALRNVCGATPVPCLVTSAMDVREVKSRAMALGARKFIPKPFFPGEVVKEIRAAVKSRVGGAPRTAHGRPSVGEYPPLPR